MTEELRKEATATVEWECTPMIDRPTFINGYITGAEPREKQIQIDAEQIRALQKQNGELTDKIRELEEQIEKMKLCQNCKFEDSDYLEKPCCDCVRCLGDIKRKGNSDKWEIKD